MGALDDPVPDRPRWVMPPALEQIVDQFDETSQLTIKFNWRGLSLRQRDRFWQELTEPRLRRTRLKRALLIAEILLDSKRSRGIPGQRLGPED